MAFPLKRAFQRGRAWGRMKGPGGPGALIVPLFRPILKRRRLIGKVPVPGPGLGLRSGNLEVRLARSAAEIDAAQALRYRVFYEEMDAHASPDVAARRRDFDRFDEHCDHLLVIDHDLGPGAEGVVGTYRLLRREAAAGIGRFYTQDEYNIRRLMQGHQEIMELGRSCVAPEYRRHQTMQLLWRGIAQYVQHYDVSLMFGCASFPGIDPDSHAMPLSYLYYNHLAPVGIRPKAVRERYVDMRRLPAGDVDQKAALTALPPLIKGYLRLGGFVGDGAVIDEQFNTTDVCIVVKTDWVTGKYVRRYNRDDQERDPSGEARLRRDGRNLAQERA